MKDSFKNRLSKALSYNNMLAVDLVNKTGISKSLISGYMNGKYEAKQDNLSLIANALNVNEAWLMGYDVPMHKQSIPTRENISKKDFNILNQYISMVNQPNKYYMCPVYGQISAGQPNWAEECLDGYFPLDPELMGIINPEEHYFLRVNGESMNKIIRNGAFALIHKQDTVNNGEIAVVLVNGDNATLKRFSKQGDIIVLTPESTDETMKQQIYTKDTPIKVIGKYVGKMEFNK